MTTDDKNDKPAALPPRRPFEPPTVTLVGNVRDMLGGDLGTVQDATGPTSKQPTP